MDASRKLPSNICAKDLRSTWRDQFTPENGKIKVDRTGTPQRSRVKTYRCSIPRNNVHHNKDTNNLKDNSNTTVHRKGNSSTEDNRKDSNNHKTRGRLRTSSNTWRADLQ